MIKLENVTKKFGEITALENISLEIKEGEFVFLIGSSGSGKTTIFRLILGEYLPTEGKIFFDDKDLSLIKGKALCELRRKVGVVFQDFKLLANRTVLENISLPLQIRKTEQKEVSEKTEAVLKMVGLWERKDLFPAQLATGEIQRVAIARAFIADPEILLADEPTGNLDPVTTKELMRILKEINEKGTTVVMATHNSEIVNELKSRVILLKEGKILSDEKKSKYLLSKDV